MNVSNNIKAIRTEKGITQSEIARIIGVERTNYHRLENRGEKLTIEQAESIAEALGVTLVELLTWGKSEENKDSDKERLTTKLSELEKQNEGLNKQLSDKELINSYREKHINELIARTTKQERLLMNYFREHLFKVAAKLNMVDPKNENPIRVNEHYNKWGKEGLTSICRAGLLSNPYVYHMVDKDIFVDDPVLSDILLEYQSDLKSQGRTWQDQIDDTV
ncbi:helix-turn-helix domain-containing protein [Spirosoma sp. RP8]|uniref:Helix-turn-helix domain-containing protein n=1 Tax=Spirosoma liriopis TaxID=2937440 RepID=A0ABT0HUN3_9BACT|nr:helix-turn-helix domain-containing protein [Spirosoma liriopis]MCK8495904.1 helix-turn-helix domain-containing protein [Spirosoma liriopis]